MLVYTVTIEENAFLQCFAATQAASEIWLANSISTCIHIIIQKSWRANCLRSRTALQKRVFLNRHCTFVVHQHGGNIAEVTAYCKRSIAYLLSTALAKLHGMEIKRRVLIVVILLKAFFATSNGLCEYLIALNILCSQYVKSLGNTLFAC